jgi:YjbE family integral membrane protein
VAPARRQAVARNGQGNNRMEIFTPEGFAALMQVIAIDLVLAGDNAVVIGLAAAGLPADQRSRAILIGVVAATVLRILFASIAAQLMGVLGLILVGGLLLLWVCWKMWRELRDHDKETVALEELQNLDINRDGTIGGAPRKTLRQAATQIIIADVSMSLDNVLAVAGAAREHPTVLIIGLVLSVALMGIAASFVARLLNRYRWIAYVGLAIIFYVACKMIYDGLEQLWPVLNGGVPVAH